MVPALEDPTAWEVALVEVGLGMDVHVEVGVYVVASFGGLGGSSALEGREGCKGAADASALVAPAGAKRLAGLVAENGLARGGVAVDGVLRENGVAAGRLVLCSAAAAGAFDEFDAGRTGIPVTCRLAEMTAWEGFGAGRGTGGEGRGTQRTGWEECRY
jgi:hypothetical protein